MVLSAIPMTIGCIKWLGKQRALYLLAILSAYAFLIETIALRTGFPYGHFTYSNALGTLIFGITPWTVPLGWVPLLIATWVLAWRFMPLIEMRILLTTFFLVGIDLILDPAAVSLGFWKYAHPGFWGGVPYTNFLGWMLSGIIGCLILQTLTKSEAEPDARTRPWLLAGFLPAIGIVILWLTVHTL